jgi:HEAT repeat protein
MIAVKLCRTTLLCGVLTLCLAGRTATAQTYTLVKGLDKFDGCPAAWRLLGKNGFVVTDPGFKQIFEPYLDDSLPVFITTDSAWHTYHLLLEDGVQQLESVQTRKLAEFSRRLWNSATARATNEGRDFSDLARFAAIGLALQDATFLASLPDQEKSLANTLLSGRGEVKPDIGFALSGAVFRAGGSETAARGYGAARQWYATVDFRLSDARETRLALCLSWVINKDPELLQLWRQLFTPWETLFGPCEDASPAVYWEELGKVAGANSSLAALRKNAPALQSRLAKLLPPPRANDQCLAADDAARFAELIKGFRLLPPRRWPGEDCFQSTIDPQIPGRMFPSGLDVLAALAQLRSPAAERALRAAGGEGVVQAARQAGGGPLPETVPGEAMRLLGKLQEPLPECVAPALRSEAWADAQLWSQLGAWAEERHTGAGRATATMDQGATSEAATGVVAPYPEFFEGLAKLALETAAALDKAGIEEPFDPKTAARSLLEGILWQEGLGDRSEGNSERLAAQLEQFDRFYCRYLEPFQAEVENNPPALQKLLNDLETLARRCSTQTAPAEADKQVLLSFFQQRQTAPRLLRDFAPVCDQLAKLARQYRDGAVPGEEDQKWIAEYGTTLARFQFYRGNAPESPRDDFPIIDCLRANAAGDAALYAGLGRPQALYIILPGDGRLQLYRGAVMTYREFVRSNAEPLDDESWRALARSGGVPPPPAFTESFFAQRDAADLLKTLLSLTPETAEDREIPEMLDELQSRVTDRDLPQLIAALGNLRRGPADAAGEGITSAIARLRWQPCQKELLALLEKNDGAQAKSASAILLQRPEWLDADLLCTNFDHVSARGRRVYCSLLARMKPAEATRAALLRALADPAPAVRWEAATDLETAFRDAPAIIAALQERLNDDNRYVVAAAAGALGRLGATNAGPALLAKLEQCLQAPEPSREAMQKQREAVREFPLAPLGEPASSRGFRQMQPRFNFAGMPRARVAAGLAGRGDEAPDVTALIEDLGDLHCQAAEERIFGLLDGSHGAAAAKALKELAPEKLARRLVAEARDQKADPQLRDRALQMLGTPPAAGSTGELIPLLDDTTVVPGQRQAAGREWRICDRAAATIGALMGRTVRIQPMQTTEQRDQEIDQIRQALKAAY